MKILAIDQSLTESGYWIELPGFNGAIIKTDPKLSATERIAGIRDTLASLHSDHNFDIIIIEGYSYGSPNRQTICGEVAGMIKLWCYDEKINLIIIPPSTIKKFVCGKGNAKKEQMLLQVYKKFDQEFDNNNIADAYALYRFYVKYIDWRDYPEDIVYTEYELECFKTFDKSQSLKETKK